MRLHEAMASCVARLADVGRDGSDRGAVVAVGARNVLAPRRSRESGNPVTVEFRARSGDVFARRTRFTAAGPVTFFVLPTKVTKESRAREAGRCAAALRCSVRPAVAQTRTIAASPRHVLRTVGDRHPRPALRCSAASRAGRSRTRSSPWPSPRLGRGESNRCAPGRRPGAGRGPISRGSTWVPACAGTTEASLDRLSPDEAQ